MTEVLLWVLAVLLVLRAVGLARHGRYVTAAIFVVLGVIVASNAGELLA